MNADDTQDKHHNDDQTDEINDAVHGEILRVH